MNAPTVMPFTCYPKNDGDVVILRGEERNWPEYLMKKLKFPFEVTIIEESDKAFFDRDKTRIGAVHLITITSNRYITRVSQATLSANHFAASGFTMLSFPDDVNGLASDNP